MLDTYQKHARRIRYFYFVVCTSKIFYASSVAKQITISLFIYVYDELTNGYFSTGILFHLKVKEIKNLFEVFLILKFSREMRTTSRGIPPQGMFHRCHPQRSSAVALPAVTTYI